MSKTFTVAGVSTLEGEVKLRVANGSAKARAAILTRGGHTDVDLIDLPKAMTKEEAAAFVAQAMGKAIPTVAAAKPKAEKAAGIKGRKTVSGFGDRVRESGFGNQGVRTHH